MKTDPTLLLAEALKLSDAERAALAAQLIASLDGEVDEDAEEAWSVEIARRMEQIDRGEVKLVPWEEVRERLRKRLGGHART